MFSAVVLENMFYQTTASSAAIKDVYGKEERDGRHDGVPEAC